MSGPRYGGPEKFGVISNHTPRWWNGRHASLRGWWQKCRRGSSPLLGTILFSSSQYRLHSKVTCLWYRCGPPVGKQGVSGSRDPRDGFAYFISFGLITTPFGITTLAPGFSLASGGMPFFSATDFTFASEPVYHFVIDCNVSVGAFTVCSRSP